SSRPDRASDQVTVRSGLQQIARVRQRTYHVRPRQPTTYVIPGAGLSTTPIPPLPAPLKPPGAAPSTFSDRVVLCAHNACSFGLPQSQMGTYVHNCAFGN